MLVEWKSGSHCKYNPRGNHRHFYAMTCCPTYGIEATCLLISNKLVTKAKQPIIAGFNHIVGGYEI